MNSNALATSRAGEAEIQIRDGIPCFTITRYEFGRTSNGMLFWGLSISDFSDGEEVIWGYSWEKEPVPLPKDTCLNYGVVPDGATIMKQGKHGKSLPIIAPPLKLNTVYLLTFNASTGNPSDPTFGYFADFCLQKDKNGDLIVQLVKNSCKNIIPPKE
jgi:hypothetical protein